MNDIPLPTLFVGHGSPMMALEDDAYTRSLKAFGKTLEGATAVAVVSAHWEQHLPVRVTAQPRPSLIYDFYGFPDELYELEYAPKGDPDLAKGLAKTLLAAGLVVEPDARRGLDHGCWVPLRHMLPDAHLPVVQVSIPRPTNPDDLVELGQRLSPLREQGVVLVGSGNIVHNLRQIDWEKDAPTREWARSFDGWFRDRLQAGDSAGAARYRADAPQSMMAVPTTEHYDPALVVMGAARRGERARHVFEGIYNGSISMRTFAFGGPPLTGPASP